MRNKAAKDEGKGDAVNEAGQTKGATGARPMATGEEDKTPGSTPKRRERCEPADRRLP